VWGSGQLVNKQKVKAAVFFVLQALFIAVELLTRPREITQAMLDAPGAAFRNSGFFVKGLWGLFTLGEIPREGSRTLVYDHSIMLMLAGIIALMFALLIIGLWCWNIHDAYVTRKKINAGHTVSDKEYFAELWDKSFEYIMITPGVLLLVFISIVPILFAVVVAFTNYNANFIPPRRLVEWTGFDTFKSIVTVPIWGGTFVRIFLWTVAWAFLATFSSYAFGLLQALLTRAKVVKWKAAWRSIFILPWAVPGFVSMLVFRAMLHSEGAFNGLLLNAHIIDQSIPFLSSVFWARLCLILVNVWLGFPYFMVLISGVLGTIPAEQYEAAQIDGANSWKQFTAITFPSIITSTSPQILMSVTFNFNNFNLIYFLTKGGPANANYQMAGNTDILISWIFKLTLDQRMYNYASALSILIFVAIASVSAWNLLRTRAFKEN
jgi:arabinogalactan oligomer/maltooligosaccharide transport system permease protein